MIELAHVLEQCPDRFLAGDVDYLLPRPGSRLAPPNRAASGSDNVGALREGRPHGGQPHPAGSADHDDALARQGGHDDTSSTAFPCTFRSISAAAASAALCHGPRQPTCGSSSPAATRLMR